MLNRRSFVKQTGMGIGALALAGGTILETGCGLWADILAYAQTGIAAFVAVVNLLVASGVIPAGTGSAIDLVITAVKAAFADVQAAVQAYDAAPASQKQTLAGKIATAITVAMQEIQQFWNDLKIPDSKLAALISGLLGIILSTLSAFLPQLPAPASLARSVPLTLPFTPKKRSVHAFKSEWNQMMVAAGQPKTF